MDQRGIWEVFGKSEYDQNTLYDFYQRTIK